MSNDQQSIPLSAAKLLVGFFTFTSTEAEKDALDEWICATEENMKIFEDCLILTDRQKQPDPQTEDEHELSVVAELISKLQKKKITIDENESLNCWINASKKNRKLFHDAPSTEDIGAIYYWLINRY